MKRLLLGVAAIALTGAATYALDGEKTQSFTLVGASSHVYQTNSGQIIEIRGENGDRTLHIERDGDASEIIVNGERISIDGNQVIINGESVAIESDSIVVVDGAEIRVLDSGDLEFEGPHFEVHFAERAEHLAQLHENLSDMNVVVDVQGIETSVLAGLEMALAGLEREHIITSDDWDELSAEEQEEALEEIAEAREEIREAMLELREEMAELQIELHEDARELQIELREMSREHAEIAREHASMEREIRIEVERAHREAERAMRDAHREQARIMRWHEERRTSDTLDGRDIRIEENSDGRRRVWIDGEEQTGEDLTRWLNELEAERLAGGSHRAGGAEAHGYRILRFGDENGGERIIELDGEQRVVILDDEAGERRFEIIIETEDD